MDTPSKAIPAKAESRKRKLSAASSHVADPSSTAPNPPISINDHSTPSKKRRRSPSQQDAAPVPPSLTPPSAPAYGPTASNIPTVRADTRDSTPVFVIDTAPAPLKPDLPTFAAPAIRTRDLKRGSPGGDYGGEDKGKDEDSDTDVQGQRERERKRRKVKTRHGSGEREGSKGTIEGESRGEGGGVEGEGEGEVEDLEAEVEERLKKREEKVRKLAERQSLGADADVADGETARERRKRKRESNGSVVSAEVDNRERNREREREIERARRKDERRAAKKARKEGK